MTGCRHNDFCVMAAGSGGGGGGGDGDGSGGGLLT